jgi:hypothetical protein
MLRGVDAQDEFPPIPRHATSPNDGRPRMLLESAVGVRFITEGVFAAL